MVFFYLEHHAVLCVRSSSVCEFQTSLDGGDVAVLARQARLGDPLLVLADHLADIDEERALADLDDLGAGCLGFLGCFEIRFGFEAGGERVQVV
jgi:hypothetical protein